MKKILFSLIMIILNISLFASNNFKKEIIKQWFLNLGMRRIELTFRNDDTFSYIESIKKNGQFINETNFNGKYKLNGRNIDMTFTDKRQLRFKILQRFYGANNVEHFILDTIGRVYETERPVIEVTQGETSRNVLRNEQANNRRNN